MKFFLPFWFSDYIHEKFDPWDPDGKGKGRKKFIWEIPWDKLPFDGLLVSRFNIEKQKFWKKQLEQKGVHVALNLPSYVPVFGDCGAWGYLNEKEPPYKPKETLEFYKKMKFTYACTIDHIILPSTYEQRYERLEITLRNAEQMKQLWDSNRDHYSFELVGVVQGWDPESYYESTKEILSMNFTYIALGGQARSPSIVTHKILKKCSPLWLGKGIKVHIFGLARWNLFDSYSKFGITSFDNAYHRRAWLSKTNNYEVDGKAYTALRIPKKKIKNKKSLEKIFKKLKEFDEGNINSNELLRFLYNYDPEGVGRFKKEYFTTLRDRPWEKCRCPLCKEIGIHICIFLGNERNMRRGFHNLWNFYREFKKRYSD